MPENAKQEIPGKPQQQGRWWVWSLVLSSFPVILLIDAGIAWLRGWSKVGLSIDEKGYLLLITGLAFAPFAFALISPTRRLLGSHGGRITVIAISIVMAMAAGEVFFRITGVKYRYHRRPAGFKFKILPDSEIMPGVFGPESNYTVNAMGIRGKMPPDRSAAYRILCIGGSTTENLYLDDSETWPALLEELLNKTSTNKKYWVGDVGIAGNDSGHHKLLLNDTEFIKQFDTLVFLVGFNDMSRYFRGMPPGDYGIAPTWKKSVLLKKMKDRFWPAGPAQGPRGEQHADLRERRAKATKRDSLPDISVGISNYSRILNEIVYTCKRLNVGCVFMTQPVLWTENLSCDAQKLCWLGDLKSGEYLTISALTEGMKSYNDVMLKVAKEQGVPCIDLSSMNGNLDYFFDDCHFTEAGAREVARIVAEGWPK